MKDVAYLWMDAHEGGFPPVDVFKGIFDRKLDLEKPENVEVAVFWHEKFLPKFAAGRDYFGNENRCCATISECKSIPDGPSDIAEEDEAFAVLAMENNIERWPLSCKIEKDPKNGKKLDQKTAFIQKKDPTEPHDDPKKFCIFTENHSDLWPPHTNVKSGQSPNGGHNDIGLNRHAKLNGVIKKKLKEEHSATWEEKLLAIVRQEMGIKGHGFEEEEQIKGGKKRKAKSATSLTVDDLLCGVELDEDEDI